MASKLLRFERDKSILVKAVKDATFPHNYSGSPTLTSAVKVKDREIPLRQASSSEELAFKAWYGKFISSILSGNVVIKLFPNEVFEKGEDKLFYAFACKKYGGADFGDEKQGRGYVIVKVDDDMWCGVACVKPEELIKIDAIAGEDEIVKAIKCAARVSKSMSRYVIPIVNVDTGEIIDYAPVGYEEVLFVEILRYLFARVRERSVA